jgi:hypothetical protein
MVAERGTTPGAKVRLVVLDAETGARRTSTVTHKISLTLHPRRADAPAHSPLISGVDQPGER